VVSEPDLNGWLAMSERKVMRMDVNKIPVWVCVVLVALALVGMWILLNYQFAGQSIRIG